MYTEEVRKIIRSVNKDIFPEDYNGSWLVSISSLKGRNRIEIRDLYLSKEEYDQLESKLDIQYTSLIEVDLLRCSIKTSIYITSDSLNIRYLDPFCKFILCFSIGQVNSLKRFKYEK